MNRLLILLAVSSVIAAGCMQAGRDDADGTDGPGDTAIPPANQTKPYTPYIPPPNGTGPPITGGGGVSFSALRTGYNGAEPSIGVTSSHQVHITAGSLAVKSADNGESWRVTSSFLTAPTSFDPYLWVDQAVDRVYHVNLYVANSYVAYSDDDGTTWTTLPAAGGPGDHQKLATGPPSSDNPVAGIAHPTVVYYAVNLLTHTQISTSYDGGHTWPNQPASVPFSCGSGGINGQPHGAPSGTAYVPYYDCDAVWAARSSDNGLTWSPVMISSDVGAGIFDPDMASDRAGNTYAAFMGGNQGGHSTYLSASTDDGGTWSDALRVAPDGLGATIFPTVVAGDEGNLWVAYYATADTKAHPDDAPEETQWYLYATHVTGAHTDDPTLQTYLLDEHPVQLGRICTGGIGCDSNRNLLEFIDTAIDPETGRLWIVYTDGCPEGCKSQADSQDRVSAVARLDAGPSLFDEAGWLEPFPQE